MGKIACLVDSLTLAFLASGPELSARIVMTYLCRSRRRLWLNAVTGAALWKSRRALSNWATWSLD